MVVARGVVDFVDGINDVDDILNGDGLVGTEHHGGLAVVANLGVDHVHELVLLGGFVVNEILVLVVDVNRDALLGHGLAVA